VVLSFFCDYHLVLYRGRPVQTPSLVLYNRTERLSRHRTYDLAPVTDTIGIDCAYTCFIMDAGHHRGNHITPATGRCKALTPVLFRNVCSSVLVFIYPYIPLLVKAQPYLSRLSSVLQLSAVDHIWRLRRCIWAIRRKPRTQHFREMPLSHRVHIVPQLL